MSKRLVPVAALFFALAPAHAADACAVKQFRWMEDCRALAKAPPAEDPLLRLRYVPLDADGDVWLTLGGEYRFKMETLDEPSYGLRPTPDFTVFDHRLYVHADLRTAAGSRLFVQLSAADERGQKPFDRPFDESALDIAQAFVDLPLERDGITFTLRVGRQELSIGQNRLVATRDAANLRRAFDMAKLDVKFGEFTLAGFAGRPVRNRPGWFDDKADQSEAFGGAALNWTRKTDAGAFTADAFLLRRERDRAVYQQSIGAEARNVAGIRLARSIGAWDGAAQASYQWGDFRTADRIGAFGVAGELGYRIGDWPWTPRIGASFGYASGDDKPTDRTLQTFDVLYPNLSYFTDAPVYYPGNSADFEPSITLTPSPELTLQAGADVIFRLSNRDAVYEPPGIPLVPGVGQGGTHTTTLAFIKAKWRAADHVELGAGYVHGFAGDVIASAGGEDFDYGLLQATLNF